MGTNNTRGFKSFLIRYLTSWQWVGVRPGANNVKSFSEFYKAQYFLSSNRNVTVSKI